MGVVECNTNGEKPSRKLVEANAAVFDNGTLDLDAWHERMQAGRSWALTNDAGFLAAHERIEDDGTCVINIWIMGVRKEARGSGAFRELVGALLAEIARTRGLWQFANTQLTMTTRPEKFAKMFAILRAAGARRCDTPEDEHAGKARFRILYQS
ncbi:Hypothetical Protein FCC1311_027212 [Hondaea fermentalgiana]|uniref:N-acetyltransferase domain-containing protein n=1 Tax=Hondaea fermentalgiana TaxID=2315210 RepID=A0A2R5G682_9STRA|nr:Hypothetical Protein FCC1311_027212 [Hondaea fermentalgiana]|eukprot:GBG26500.1 Hypothetical Protein FCC1311_027212 [Hondaea fermentalgiana]